MYKVSKRFVFYFSFHTLVIKNEVTVYQRSEAATIQSPLREWRSSFRSMFLMAQELAWRAEDQEVPDSNPTHDSIMLTLPVKSTAPESSFDQTLWSRVEHLSFAGYQITDLSFFKAHSSKWLFVIICLHLTNHERSVRDMSVARRSNFTQLHK